MTNQTNFAARIEQDQSVVKLPGLVGTYKGHDFNVSIGVEFDPNVWSFLILECDGQFVPVYEFAEVLSLDKWHEFAAEGDRYFESEDFQACVRSLLDAYLESITA